MAREAREVRLPRIKVDNGRLLSLYCGLTAKDGRLHGASAMARQQFEEVRPESGGRTRAVRPGRRQTTECRAHCACAIRARGKSPYLEGDSTAVTSSS